jgi:hypothetical protein
MSDNLKVGDIVWFFDDNHRVYETDKNGLSHGGPIWRKKWKPCKVLGETTRSFVLEYGQKIPKKNKPNGLAYSEQELNEKFFVHENAYKIGCAVKTVKDAEKLKLIAKIIGYNEK